MNENENSYVHVPYNYALKKGAKEKAWFFNKTAGMTALDGLSFENYDVKDVALVRTVMSSIITEDGCKIAFLNEDTDLSAVSVVRTGSRLPVYIIGNGAKWVRNNALVQKLSLALTIFTVLAREWNGERIIERLSNIRAYSSPTGEKNASPLTVFSIDSSAVQKWYDDVVKLVEKDEGYLRKDEDVEVITSIIDIMKEGKRTSFTADYSLDDVFLAELLAFLKIRLELLNIVSDERVNEQVQLTELPTFVNDEDSLTRALTALSKVDSFKRGMSLFQQNKENYDAEIKHMVQWRSDMSAWAVSRGVNKAVLDITDDVVAKYTDIITDAKHRIDHLKELYQYVESICHWHMRKDDIRAREYSDILSFYSILNGKHFTKDEDAWRDLTLNYDVLTIEDIEKMETSKYPEVGGQTIKDIFEDFTKLFKEYYEASDLAQILSSATYYYRNYNAVHYVHGVDIFEEEMPTLQMLKYDRTLYNSFIKNPTVFYKDDSDSEETTSVRNENGSRMVRPDVLATDACVFKIVNETRLGEDQRSLAGIDKCSTNKVFCDGKFFVRARSWKNIDDVAITYGLKSLRAAFENRQSTIYWYVSEKNQKLKINFSNRVCVLTPGSTYLGTIVFAGFESVRQRATTHTVKACADCDFFELFNSLPAFMMGSSDLTLDSRNALYAKAIESNVRVSEEVFKSDAKNEVGFLSSETYDTQPNYFSSNNPFEGIFAMYDYKKVFTHGILNTGLKRVQPGRLSVIPKNFKTSSYNLPSRTVFKLDSLKRKFGLYMTPEWASYTRVFTMLNDAPTSKVEGEFLGGSYKIVRSGAGVLVTVEIKNPLVILQESNLVAYDEGKEEVRITHNWGDALKIRCNERNAPLFFDEDLQYVDPREIILSSQGFRFDTYRQPVRGQALNSYASLSLMAAMSAIVYYSAVYSNFTATTIPEDAWWRHQTSLCIQIAQTSLKWAQFDESERACAKSLCDLTLKTWKDLREGLDDCFKGFDPEKAKTEDWKALSDKAKKWFIDAWGVTWDDSRFPGGDTNGVYWGDNDPRVIAHLSQFHPAMSPLVYYMPPIIEIGRDLKIHASLNALSPTELGSYIQEVINLNLSNQILKEK